MAMWLSSGGPSPYQLRTNDLRRCGESRNRVSTVSGVVDEPPRPDDDVDCYRDGHDWVTAYGETFCRHCGQLEP
jgi:hypothetical protein